MPFGASEHRAKLTAKAVTHPIAAHDPLGARLSERAGVDGVCAGGVKLPNRP